MSTPARRMVTLLDLLALIAATAMGLALLRPPSMASETGHWPDRPAP